MVVLVRDIHPHRYEQSCREVCLIHNYLLCTAHHCTESPSYTCCIGAEKVVSVTLEETVRVNTGSKEQAESLYLAADS